MAERFTSFMVRTRWAVLPLMGMVVGCARQFAQPVVLTKSVPLHAAAVLSSLAPLGHTAIVVTGGAPPYALKLASNPSDPGAVLSEDGGFTAGVGDQVGFQSTFDTALIRDQVGASVAVSISIGPPLQLFPKNNPAAPTTTIPGGNLTFVATGGQPPYAFALMPNGNTSWGAMTDGGLGLR